jgi:hypothetical protein
MRSFLTAKCTSSLVLFAVIFAGCSSAQPQNTPVDSPDEIMARLWQGLTEKANGGWEKYREGTLADLAKTQQNLREAEHDVAVYGTDQAKELANRLGAEAALIGQARSWAGLQYPAIISSLQEMFKAAEAKNSKGFVAAANRTGTLIAALKKQLSDAQATFNILAPNWNEMVATIKFGLNDMMLPAVLKSQFSPGLMSLYFLGVGSGYDQDVTRLELRMQRDWPK